MTDLTTMPDDELEQLRVDVLAEQGRRRELVQIPEQVADLAHAYRAAGGDSGELAAAIVSDAERSVGAPE